jgi:hypothetical protein
MHVPGWHTLACLEDLEIIMDIANNEEHGVDECYQILNEIPEPNRLELNNLYLAKVVHELPSWGGSDEDHWSLWMVLTVAERLAAAEERSPRDLWTTLWRPTKRGGSDRARDCQARRKQAIIDLIASENLPNVSTIPSSISEGHRESDDQPIR